MPRSQRHMRDNPSIYASDSSGQRNYGAPKDIALSSATVTAAAAADAVVGDLTTTDANDNTGFVYSLVSQSLDTKFKVVAAQLQVMTTGLGTGTRTVTIRSRDPKGLYIDKTFTITVT